MSFSLSLTGRRGVFCLFVCLSVFSVRCLNTSCKLEGAAVNQLKFNGNQFRCLLWTENFQHLFVVYLSVPDYRDDVPELYEGDMALTKQQVKILKPSRLTFNKAADLNQEAQTRGAIENVRQLWPDGIIPFEISSQIGTWPIIFLSSVASLELYKYP